MRRVMFLLLALCVGFVVTPSGQAGEPIKIGLAAAVSGGSAASGEAIKRGLQIAMDEVNAQGGVLGGRKLELVIRDDEGNPAKGVTIARELVERRRGRAGMYHPPRTVRHHRRSLQPLGQWITDNGYRITGPCREVYLEPARDGSQTDPNTVTEIQFPVEKVAK